MKESKGKSFLAVLFILILLLLIVLPPIFRIVFKEEVKVEPKEEVQTEILTCEILEEQQVSIQIRNIYTDDIITSSEISYLTTLQELLPAELLFINEYALDVTPNGDYSKVVIDEMVNNEFSDARINNLFIDKEIAKNYIESLNFTCEEQ